VRSAQKKVQTLRLKAKKSLRAARIIEAKRPPINPPKVVEMRGEEVTLLPHDRGTFPRSHGHPLDVIKSQLTGKPLKRVKGAPNPVVRVEPLLLDGNYNNPRTSKWKRLESKTHSKGIPFVGPLSFKSVRSVYYCSVTLNSLYWLCESAKDMTDFRLAKREYHSTRRFFQNRMVLGGESPFCAAILQQCAIKLRSTKFELRSADYGLDPPLLFV
jgi:hypothetical protein